MAKQSVKPNQGCSRDRSATVPALDRRIAFSKLVILVAALVSLQQASASAEILTGQSAFTDYTKESPGVRRKLTVADLPAPYATLSADNPSHVVDRPANAWPQGPPGFKVTLYATELDNPRLIRTAPNGDLFLAESQSGKIRVFRGVTADGHAAESHVFATGLRLPFGISFYPNGADPKWVYVGNTDSVVRFPYQNGDTQARGHAQLLAELPGGPVSCEGAATGLAMLFFLETANGCLCRSVLTQTWTIPTPTPGKPEEQRFLNSHREANS